MMQDVLKVRTRTLGLTNPDTLESMKTISVMYHGMGRNDEAIALSLEVSTLQASVLGKKHPETITAMINVAALHWVRGRYDEAIDLGLQALQLSTEVNGPEDGSTIMAMGYLSQAYESKGNLAEAEKYMVRVLDCEIRLKGYQHVCRFPKPYLIFLGSSCFCSHALQHFDVVQAKLTPRFSIDFNNDINEISCLFV